ncbi:unnamed protein product [Psylliodes chrysocephalus]|uniref:MADF domain-containing protein n=1 Tax=Psylliodes chrysocephalus TaxID=3402493 RepID=A0A9P0GHF6_9CUCU|nr:unnamed protein product [Psylliodes chrysocephala]
MQKSHCLTENFALLYSFVLPDDLLVIPVEQFKVISHALLHIHKQDVERKIKNLKSHFARERKKKAETRRTGSSADEPYVSKWFAYQALLFLAETNKPRNTVNNVEDQLAVITPTKVPKTKDFKLPKTPKTKSAKRKLTDNLASSNTPILNKPLNLMRLIQSRRVDSKSKDKYSLFGEQVAMKLRRITSLRKIFMVQNSITQVLFDVEMGMYVPHTAQSGATYGNIQPSTSTRLFSAFSSSYQSSPGISLSQTQNDSPHPSHSASPSYSQLPSPLCSQSPSPSSIFSDIIIEPFSRDILQTPYLHEDEIQH